MAARSSWKGYLKISLVSVPVKAYTATNSAKAIALNQLHEPCHSRIKYQKVCPVHGAVSSDEIVSGYEYAKDQYAVIDTSELKKLRSESDKSIVVDQFVDEAQVDNRYLAGACYFLVPDGAVGQQAYALIRDVMRDSKMNGIAKIVLSNREQLVLIRPVENLIGMLVLRHADELKTPAAFSDEVVDTQLSDQEMQLTKQLMQGLYAESFDLERYPDDYTEKLTALIQSKVEGKELVTPEAHDEPQVINLMEALKASIQQVSPGQTAPKSQAASKSVRSKKTAAKKTATKKAKSAKSPRTSVAKKRKSG
ncbi:MAG: Ku protein [bacterium]|nr:Ku protein [bacterium]